MLAETICAQVADAIERRIETDFGEYKIIPASTDKLRETGNRLCLRITTERISADDKGASPPFATIEVRCDRLGLVKYESVVHAYMDLDEVADDLAKLSIDENILKRYRAMEPEVITTTRQGISRVVVQLVGGSEEKEEIFVHRKLNVSFNIARMTMGLSDILAGGPKEAFEDVAKATSESMRALREIREIVSRKSGRMTIPSRAKLS